MLSGSRVAVVNVPADALVLRPPASSEGIADVGAAVRDALRFPLSGAPLEALVKRGGRVTIVVEAPELPLPGAPDDPRREALAATLAELERLGVPSAQQTILVAGGLNRRAGHREQEALLRTSSCPPVPRPGRGSRRRVAGSDPPRRRGPHAVAHQPEAHRDRPRRHRDGGRDGAARRPGGAARRLRS